MSLQAIFVSANCWRIKSRNSSYAILQTWVDKLWPNSIHAVDWKREWAGMLGWQHAGDIKYMFKLRYHHFSLSRCHPFSRDWKIYYAFRDRPQNNRMKSVGSWGKSRNDSWDVLDAFFSEASLMMILDEHLCILWAKNNRSTCQSSPYSVVQIQTTKLMRPKLAACNCAPVKRWLWAPAALSNVRMQGFFPYCNFSINMTMISYWVWWFSLLSLFVPMTMTEVVPSLQRRMCRRSTD